MSSNRDLILSSGHLEGNQKMQLVRLEKTKALNLFRVGKSPTDIIGVLYAMVFGPASAIKSMEGVPKISLETHNVLTRHFKQLGDIGGALWIQYGFHVGPDVPDWCVDISDVNITS